ncbi:MAG: VOC family protein [Deltaproteobacteria bacterium]|nr:VOC family protein [Deltaproteobacteria bacterium]
MKLSSQITFLYFKEMHGPAHFFEEILGLQKVDDQGFARIYKISGGAFIGIVDEAKGYCDAPTAKNVLITLVTENVHQWYRRLKDAGLAIDAAPTIQEKANVECFFFEGPGGYAFEVQRFLNPEIEMHFM